MDLPSPQLHVYHIRGWRDQISRFFSCDLEVYPMILIYKTDMTMVKKMYLQANSAFHHSGSVNEYHLRLQERQRQVWFIPLADERGVCR